MANALAGMFGVGAVAITDAVEKLTQIVLDAFEALGPIIDQMVKLWEHESSKPPDDDRLRHGRAAFCPRHGPTSGGLCRRCARR